MKSGIYIHIPFCKSRCIYCGFYSTTNSNKRRRYVDALLKEMQMRRETTFQTTHGCGCADDIDTIYIGGGTPSSLSPNDLSRILKTVSLLYSGTPREVTIEMNPDDITPELTRQLADMGVNRVSMGIQTFNEERLRFLRRRHSAQTAMAAVDTVRDNGIENVSIDLMFGFPNETLYDWQDDIKTALSLNPSHISAYCLMYEEGTPLYRMLEKKLVEQIDEDTYLAMYTELIDQLSSNGYDHYEISNFALPGCRSIHNSSYWHDTPYLGFGASAHSYIGNRRSWNVANIDAYINGIEQGQLPQESEDIDADTHYNDLITTALRTREGLDLSTIDTCYRNYAMDNAEDSIKAGLLEVNNGHMRLTRKGIFVSDSVMSDLVKV